MLNLYTGLMGSFWTCDSNCGVVLSNSMVRNFKNEEYEYEKKQYQFSTIKFLVNEENRYGKLGYQG